MIGRASPEAVSSGSPRRTCLVGAGAVASLHAAVLHALPDVSLVGVCDVDPGRARAFSAANEVDHVFTGVSEVIQSGLCDFAHVLVPPDAHGEVAAHLIDGGMGVLVEKPMSCSSGECLALIEGAENHGVALGVNHNAIFYPAHVKLRSAVNERQVGPLQHLIVLVNLPRSAVPPPGHWMLRAPGNLMFEFGPHPFSQILDLAGPLLSAETIVSGRHPLPSGRHYFDTWQVSMQCEVATAQLFHSYAGSYRSWLEIAVCEDGTLVADMEMSSLVVRAKTPWGPYIDLPQRALSVARQELLHGIRSLGREALSTIRPTPRRDPYFISMRDSIGTFYASSGIRGYPGSARYGADVVAMCEAVTAGVAERAPAPARSPLRHHASHVDAAVLGGTGFIGRAVVEEMVRRGMTVRVMARHPMVPGAAGGNGAVQTCVGDIADPEALRRAINGAARVVHLAHGGSFTWNTVEATVIRPARQIADACLEYAVDRLVFTGTIASLYLGDAATVVTGSTPTDPRLGERGPYEWGKARAEEVLRESFIDHSLPVCILRPGIVLGAGGSPFHGGFGIWRGDVHCIGWNLGGNPLPLVLATDVADAIVAALQEPAAVGKTYNLVGDVRLPARECVAELRSVLERPLVFHPRLPSQNQALAMTKWIVKRASGTSAWRPSYRSIKSMGCHAMFDCSDVKHDLRWQPQQDTAEFIRQALHVHRNGRPR